MSASSFLGTEYVSGAGIDPVVTSFAAPNTSQILRIIFAAGNSTYMMQCNQGNQKDCESHCIQQFPMDATARHECTLAVQNGYTSSGGGGGCFPLSSSVYVKDRGFCTVKDLKVGDLVMSSQSVEHADEPLSVEYQRVIAFLHFVPKTNGLTHQMLRFVTSSGATLKIHPEHIVPVTSDGATVTYKQAIVVREGERLYAPWIDGSLAPVAVKWRGMYVEEDGIACPVTESGMIVVDGVLCSCYSPPRSIFEKVSMVMSCHAACHIALLPLRMYGSEHSEDTEYIHPWAESLLSYVYGTSATRTLVPERKAIRSKDAGECSRLCCA